MADGFINIFETAKNQDVIVNYDLFPDNFTAVTINTDTDLKKALNIAVVIEESFTGVDPNPTKVKKLVLTATQDDGTEATSITQKLDKNTVKALILVLQKVFGNLT